MTLDEMDLSDFTIEIVSPSDGVVSIDPDYGNLEIFSTLREVERSMQTSLPLEQTCNENRRYCLNEVGKSSLVL